MLYLFLFKMVNDAINKAKEEDFDLVVCDLVIPI